MAKEVIQSEDPKVPAVPGIAMAGKVICPLLSIGRFAPCECLKQGCELWVELTYPHEEGVKVTGRCSLAWSSILSTELRQAVDRTAVKKTDISK